MSVRSKTIGMIAGAAAAFTAVGGIYYWATTYSNKGDEYNILMNRGTPLSIKTAGLTSAWGWYDKVLRLPKGRQITTIKDEEITLRSKSGEEFIGGLRVEYQFRFGATDEEQRKNIVNLISNFSITDTASFWDTKEVDPAERAVNARAKTAAVTEFAKIDTDEYQDKMTEIAEKVRKTLQQKMDDEKIPLDVVVIDTTGVTPSPQVQERINRIASERRESDRAAVIIDNSAKLTEAADAEAKVVLAFTNALREQGYSEESILVLNCQRLADRADRFGIPFGNPCGGNDNAYNVVVDPSKVAAMGGKKAVAAQPATPLALGAKPQ